MAEWFEEAFRADYLRVYPHRGDREAVREIRAWLGRLPGLEEGSPVLDLACGAGRHVRAMRGEGIRAFGCDLSADLLEEAERRGTDGLVRGDLRRLPFCAGAFRAAVSFFTSFGYFASEAEDVAVLREVARVLAPGGGFLLDLMDPEATRRDLVPRTRGWKPGARIGEERWISADGRRVEKRVTVEGEAGLHTWVESVRLYHPLGVEELAAPAGFRPAGRFGGHGPEPWRSGATPRCVVLFTRQAP